MEAEFKKTESFLIGYMKTKGRKNFNELSIKEYNSYAKKYGLLNTYSISYITGLNWRYYKNKLLKGVTNDSRRERSN